MSDEESFVILGTSPTASLDIDGINGDKSLSKDTPPGSCFGSLKNSQINELEQAREALNQTPTRNVGVHTTSSLAVAQPFIMTTSSGPSMSSMKRSSESLLWSKPPINPIQTDIELSQTEEMTQNKPSVQSTNENENNIPLTLEDCAIAPPVISPLNSLAQSENKENQRPPKENMSNSQSSIGSKKNSMMASSFIMGEVDADVLKTSVYSQFPSISMQACAEDVVKLQNMITEYTQLKNTLDKVNSTMKLFYDNSLQWKEKMNHLEVYYREQLDNCQKQIVDLRDENSRLKKSIDEQVDHSKAVEVACKTDLEKMVQKISEKSSLIENMRAQIVKLEEQQQTTFEFLPKKIKENGGESKFELLYITRSEHEKEVKSLKREMSELLASNLDLKDMEKQYHDEITCVKFNLEKAEKLMQSYQNELLQLQNLNSQNQSKIDELQISNSDLQLARDKQNDRISMLEKENQNLLAQINEQNERILLLEQQNQVHKTDFEMERESRQTAVGEKQQILQDLRALQKRNQELIEEHQRYIENFEKRLSFPQPATSVNFAMSNSPLVAAAAAAQSYVNNPQRPIRDMSSKHQSPFSNNPSTPPTDMYNCPVCNKGFKSLSVLTSHVNDCIDKN